MKNRIFAWLFVLLLLTGCTAGSTVEEAPQDAAEAATDAAAEPVTLKLAGIDITGEPIDAMVKAFNQAQDAIVIELTDYGTEFGPEEKDRFHIFVRDACGNDAGKPDPDGDEVNGKKHDDKGDKKGRHLPERSRGDEGGDKSAVEQQPEQGNGQHTEHFAEDEGAAFGLCPPENALSFGEQPFRVVRLVLSSEIFFIVFSHKNLLSGTFIVTEKARSVNGIAKIPLCQTQIFINIDKSCLSW